MKRLFDIICAGFGLLFFLPALFVIAVAIRAESRGPILYMSRRVGRHSSLFLMPKFRSMRTEAPVVATHLLGDPDRYLTRVGRFLRRTSLDELPQLFSVLKGDMSLVGPRPALFNQHDLNAMRAAKGVDRLRPGITGWAQVNGRDELPIPEKVAYDIEYLQRQSFWFDLKILFMTVHRVITAHGVSH
ncbi:sugar transferase [Niveibacterium microcysteis]|uniref:Sugar transferase n=1 Tax=Niveibacterium microcysteis TaxID=2811415 RepID=A0ABX7M1C9_9RHOO|nr:sugar transferase [Niveibacterium microcysteis]QSI75578.1 sugar transferase [Niveibacterium microcysteis]